MDLLIGTLFLILVLIILHYLRIKRLTECVRWEHWQTRYCDILSRSIQQVCWWKYSESNF